MRSLHSFAGCVACVTAIQCGPAASVEAEETLRLPITRDTWFSAYGNEADANLGGASRMKLKSIQEMSPRLLI